MASELDLIGLTTNPYDNFLNWLSEAEKAEVVEPTAMTLATVDAQGRPHARVVLYKGFSTRPDGQLGFKLFTNYESPKAADLQENGFAALVFFWAPLGRQIRVEGRVEKLPEAESDAYFASRPRGSQIGAWASPQSKVIKSRAELLERVRFYEEKFANVSEVPRPPNWGGWRLMPELFEFWQAGEFRLHDRFRFEKAEDGTWKICRLAP